MAEQSHRDEMNAAIRAQRERHAAPKTIAPVDEPIDEPAATEEPAPQAATEEAAPQAATEEQAPEAASEPPEAPAPPQAAPPPVAETPAPRKSLFDRLRGR
jgi:hypothetical protein